MSARLLHGDCRSVLAELPSNHIDAVATDPPFGLHFMGKSWDAAIPQRDAWEAVLRVAKPGAPLVAFGGTRTFHRLTCAIEDAGWEIRDSIADLFSDVDAGAAFLASLSAEQRRLLERAAPSALLAWEHGQGFPKSHNGPWGGTALKPAFEPIILARKPLEGTVAGNFEAHGTGGLNIDACRVGTSKDVPASVSTRSLEGFGERDGRAGQSVANGGHNPNLGRWPANVVLSHTERCEVLGKKRVRGAAPPGPAEGSRAHGLVFAQDAFTKAMSNGARVQHVDADGTEEVDDWRCTEDCPVRLLDEQSGIGGQGRSEAWQERRGGTGGIFGRAGENTTAPVAALYDGCGGASRFFYCAKATRAERGAGNDHPTVKPLALMRWLVRLVSRPGAVILDPFMGSGTTGLACAAEGRDFIGCELDAHNVEIARRRLAADAPLFAAGGAA